MNKPNLFTDLKLDNQEQRLEKAFGRGEFAKVPNLGKNKKLFEEAAKNYRQLQKSKRITIRVNKGDLIKVKAKARKNNILYQTLLNALIRQFAEGRTSIQF